MLMLKKVWDSQDTNLYIQESRRFTASGLKAYWEAIDRTVRYFDSIVLKKRADLRKVQKPGRQHHHDQRDHTDRFCWKTPKFNRVESSQMPFRKLPAPPVFHNEQ